MAGRKFTRRPKAPSTTPVNPSGPASDDNPSPDEARLVIAIEAQRRRMFQVSALAACLGHVLQDVYVPGKVAPELSNVTDLMIQLLDNVVAGLDPTVLKLRTPPLFSEEDDLADIAE